MSNRFVVGELVVAFGSGAAEHFTLPANPSTTEITREIRTTVRSFVSDLSINAPVRCLATPAIGASHPQCGLPNDRSTGGCFGKRGSNSIAWSLAI
jgi:hypothetical protein